MSEMSLGFSRRGMLATASAAASLGVLGASAQTDPEFSTRSAPTVDVLVIGGGLAGLATARALKDQGVSVLVLEARDRTGGRIHSETLTQGLTIDLGAQFIGDNQTRISSLVDEVGLTRVAAYAQGVTAHTTGPGETPNFMEGDRLPLSLLGQFDALQTVWRFDRKLENFRNEIDRYDQMTAAEFLASFSFSEKTANFFSSYVEAELCVSLDEISAYEVLDQAASVGGFEGEGSSAQWYLAEGMAPVAQHLADILGTSVVTGEVVSEIERNRDRFRVTATSGTYHAARVVIAVPPQLYGRLGLFPLLDQGARNVFRQYQAGQAIKTMLVFREPWWRHLGSSGGVMSQNDVFNAVVDGSPADGRHGVLVMFSTARSAARLRRVGNEEKRIELARSWLADLRGANVPEPIAGRSIDWNADPLSLGGYASRSAPGSWAAMPSPFAPRDGLFFVGTETASEWRSFMEGALQSAEHAAHALVEKL